MAQINARLFGGFELSDASGVELKLNTRKTRGLLAFLIVEANRWHTRDRLADLLWSNRQQAQARHSLTQALSAIRKLGEKLGIDLIESDSERVRLLAGAVSADALLFREKLGGDFAEAVKIYAGPLLDGFQALDPSFDEWLVEERAAFHEQVCMALERAIGDAEARGDLIAGLAAAKRWVAIDPYAEPAYRRLMFLHAASGDRPEAIRQYHVCAQLLANELGVEPSGETKSLVEEIRARGVSSHPWPVNKPMPSSASSIPALPDRPSIAVLPFDNLTGDPEQEYFADGMTEDITTGLSRFPSLFVISRNSSFSYKGTSPDVRDVARDLGVRYVLDGSVRKSKEQIRITAQLVEANSGKQIWAERYDRKLGDIFALQDEITAAIIAAIAPEIDEAERMLARRRPPQNLDVWSRYQLGLTAAYMTTKEALESAVVQLDEVNALDPNFAPAFAYGVVARLRLMRHFTGFDDELVEQAHDKARSGIAVDPRNPDCLMSLCRVYLELAQYELAIAKAEEALSLNPNSATANFLLGYSLSRSGRPEDAITYLDRAILLSPRDISIGGFCGVKGVALFHLGRYQESAHWAQRSISSPNPRPIALLYLMGALMKLERTKEAAAMIPALMRVKPELTLSEMREKIEHDYGRLADAVEMLFVALCDLGLPK